MTGSVKSEAIEAQFHFDESLIRERFFKFDIIPKSDSAKLTYFIKHMFPYIISL